MEHSKMLNVNVTRGEPEMVRALGKNHTHNREVKQLSDIDDQEGCRFFVSVVIFYPPSVEGGILDPADSIRDGLAKVLDFYYPLAGRVYEGPNRKLLVNCNNEGVVLVKARADVKIEELGNGIAPPCPYSEKLVCDDVQNYGGILGGPLLYFQVTTFECGGFTMGISFNHTLLDGSGLVQFLTALGDMVKGSSSPSILPVWKRDLLNARSPPRATCIHNEYDNEIFKNNRAPQHSYDTFILTSVIFSPKDIQALRTQLPTTQATSSSIFDILTACLWKFRTVALEPHPDDLVRVSIITNMHLRKNNLPRGYYGNAFSSPAAISKAGDLCASPLGYALELVQKAKSEMSDEYMQSVADLMVIRGRPKYSEEWNFLVSDLRGLGSDKLDLGWGKPLFCGIPWATPVISFYYDMKIDEGEAGIVVPICLPSSTLDKFQTELLKMTSKPMFNV